MSILNALIAPVAGLFDKIIPDPKARDAAKIELMKLQNSQELELLSTQLSAIVGEGYDKQVYLYADQDVPYGLVMEVTAEVRRAGYTRMSFITEQKE
jgi:biopolymer transport protein ExbD